MKAVLTIFVAAAALSFGQTNTKKAPQPAAHPDAWQKSKECAAQAEKVMAEWRLRAPALTDWHNHYSRKYDRCFIEAFFFFPDGGPGKAIPALSNGLMDAFERSILADSASVGPADGFCHIDEKPADCAKAASFISEHMKN